MGEIMKDFFGELRRAIRHKCEGQAPLEIEEVIDATLEALKEMMVGRPINAIVEHEINQDGESSCTEEWTTIDSHPLYLDRYAECGFSGHHGTDGEEVCVIVFRRGKKLVVPEEPPLDEEDE